MVHCVFAIALFCKKYFCIQFISSSCQTFKRVMRILCGFGNYLLIICYQTGTMYGRYIRSKYYIYNYILEWSIARVIVELWLELRLANCF